MSYKPPKQRKLYEFDPTGQLTETTTTNISPYLIDGPSTILGTHRKPLVPNLPPAIYGSMGNDDGGLIVEPEDAAEFRADPIAKMTLRPYVGTQEVLYNRERWAIWLHDVSPAEIRKSKLLMERLEQVRKYRSKSNRKSTKAAAATPGLFIEPRPIGQRFLFIPYASSEARTYIPLAFLDPPTLVRAPSWCIKTDDLYIFGVLSSSMWSAWVRTVSGRLENRLQLSPGTSYNNFPFADPNPKQKKRVHAAAQQVLDARTGHRDATLADLYDPAVTPTDLLKAHQRLDKAVESVIAPRRKFNTDGERLSLLLERYVALRDGTSLPF